MHLERVIGQRGVMITETGVEFTNGKRPGVVKGIRQPKPAPHCYNACMKGSSYCFECKRPLVEIDNRGYRLRGCLTCNIWWSLTGGGPVKLSVEDLQALQQLRRTKPSDGSIIPRPKGKTRQPNKRGADRNELLLTRRFGL